MTQCDRILEYMTKRGSITSAEAINELGCYRLASRIHDLRDRGYDIVKTMVSAENRYGDIVSFARYTLKQAG